MDVRSLAEQINQKSHAYEIGKLQVLRAHLKGMKRVPGSSIFSAQTTFENWAFHHGGRSELQFNIGVENVNGQSIMRFGLAFSFEPSRSLPSIDVLIPKVALFNEYIRANFDSLAPYQMWHSQEDSRSASRLPAPIPASLVTTGTFVFLGDCCPPQEIDVDEVLSTFDRLLPLYQFVESGREAAPEADAFLFHAGNHQKKRRASGTMAERALSIDLRHNELQATLFRELSAEFGAQNVGTEVQSGTGGRIDAVSRNGGAYTFYEIKVGQSVQLLIRQALGQLFEYAMWPGATRPKHLVVVGEPDLNAQGKEYLQRLNEALPIHLSYRRATP